jgi:YD repeat-containing protein
MGATYNNRNQLVSRQPGGALLFRGTLNEPGSVTVGATPAQVAPNNTFVAQAPVPPTASNVSVVAKDASNNTRTNVYQVQASAGSTVTYTHDLNGNLTSDGTKTYEWDAENRLTAVKQGATTLAAFTYDAEGRRAQKTSGGVTISFVYDSSEVLEARSSAGGTTRHVHGPAVDQHWATVDAGGTTGYFLSDHLGSVVQVTTSSGTTSSARKYDPFGGPLAGASSSGYSYTGREWDAESGLY